MIEINVCPIVIFIAVLLVSKNDKIIDDTSKQNTESNIFLIASLNSVSWKLVFDKSIYA